MDKELNRIEQICVELAKEFNDTCDPRAYFKLITQIDNYSDYYMSLYGTRPYTFGSTILLNICGEAKEVMKQYETMGRTQWIALRDMYVGEQQPNKLK